MPPLLTGQARPSALAPGNVPVLELSIVFCATPIATQPVPENAGRPYPVDCWMTTIAPEYTLYPDLRGTSRSEGCLPTRLRMSASADSAAMMILSFRCWSALLVGPRGQDRGQALLPSGVALGGFFGREVWEQLPELGLCSGAQDGECHGGLMAGRRGDGRVDDRGRGGAEARTQELHDVLDALGLRELDVLVALRGRQLAIRDGFVGEGLEVGGQRDLGHLVHLGLEGRQLARAGLPRRGLAQHGAALLLAREGDHVLAERAQNGG